MIITGYMLKEALRQQTLTRDAVISLFDDSLRRFKDEDKKSPDMIVEEFLVADRNIARLQSAQAFYNLAVEVEVQCLGGGVLSLAEAVKLLGGVQRSEKLWKDAAVKEEDPYGRSGVYERREKDVEVQVATIGRQECLQRALKVTKLAGAIRAAIANGNQHRVEVDLGKFGLDAQLFS